MNSCRLFSKICILVTVIFLICGGEEAICVESQFPASPKAKIAKKGQRDEVKPAEIKQQEGKNPAFLYKSDSPDRNAIGCVLPLSGRYGDYGSKALDAILFATGIFNGKSKSSWKIVAEDSQGLPEIAKDAVARLAKTGGVIAIIAVAGTQEAVEVAHEADKWAIPTILITPREGVTKANYYVFQHFLTPSQQIKALANYALDNLNCTIFSILYPQDDYGVEMAKIFRAETESIGGKIQRTIPYDKKKTDFTEEISKVTGDGVSIAKDTNAGNQETKAPISIDFEALFIPDSSQRVKMIASQLAFYDVKGIKLLGTSLWNYPDLLMKDAECLEGAVFADSFFVNGFYPETNDFVDSYYSAYSREPENIEALSYDTMGMIISVLENKNIATREQFIAGLQRVADYKGATGITSFSEDRVSQKRAFILKVKDGKLEQVKLGYR